MKKHKKKRNHISEQIETDTSNDTMEIKMNNDTDSLDTEMTQVLKTNVKNYITYLDMIYQNFKESIGLTIRDKCTDSELLTIIKGMNDVIFQINTITK